MLFIGTIEHKRYLSLFDPLIENKNVCNYDGKKFELYFKMDKRRIQSEKFFTAKINVGAKLALP